MDRRVDRSFASARHAMPPTSFMDLNATSAHAHAHQNPSPRHPTLNSVGFGCEHHYVARTGEAGSKGANDLCHTPANQQYDLHDR